MIVARRERTTVIITLFLLAGSLLFGSSLARAGWLAQGQGVRIFASENLVRVMARGPECVFDLKADRIIYLNPAKKLYWTGPPSEFKKAMQKVVEDRALARLAGLPAEQRSAFEKVILGKIRPRPDTGEYEVGIEDLGKGEDLAGWPTRRYNIVVDGRLVEEIWLAEAPELEKEWDMSAFLRMSLAMAPGEPPAWQLYQKVLEVKGRGLTLKTVLHLPGGKTHVTSIQMLEQRRVPPEFFTPPAGWREAPLGRVLP